MPKKSFNKNNMRYGGTAAATDLKSIFWSKVYLTVSEKIRYF